MFKLFKYSVSVNTQASMNPIRSPANIIMLGAFEVPSKIWWKTLDLRKPNLLHLRHLLVLLKWIASSACFVAFSHFHNQSPTEFEILTKNNEHSPHHLGP